MARVFISFDIEDIALRNLFVEQTRNVHPQIDFKDISVKWDWSTSWQSYCRARIKSCAGIIGIITPNTSESYGQLWELRCAIENEMPLLLIHGHSEPERRIEHPPEVISLKQIEPWNGENIDNFLNGLERLPDGMALAHNK